MTQEDKQLLLVDLCSRLLYGVKVITTVGGEIRNDKEQLNFAQLSLFEAGYEDVKPYLFPMSSITREQEIAICAIQDMGLSYYHLIIDHYNEWHLDYRGLIGKGLAIDCTNLNIY